MIFAVAVERVDNVRVRTAREWSERRFILFGRYCSLGGGLMIWYGMEDEMGEEGREDELKFFLSKGRLDRHSPECLWVWLCPGSTSAAAGET